MGALLLVPSVDIAVLAGGLLISFALAMVVVNVVVAVMKGVVECKVVVVDAVVVEVRVDVVSRDLSRTQSARVLVHVLLASHSCATSQLLPAL